MSWLEDMRVQLEVLALEARANVDADPKGAADAMRAGQYEMLDEHLLAGHISVAFYEGAKAEIEAGYAMFLKRRGL